MCKWVVFLSFKCFVFFGAKETNLTNVVTHISIAHFSCALRVTILLLFLTSFPQALWPYHYCFARIFNWNFQLTSITVWYMQDQLIVSTANQKVLLLHIESVNEYCYNFNNDGILSLRASSFPRSFMLSHPDSPVISLINIWRVAGNSHFSRWYFTYLQFLNLL